MGKPPRKSGEKRAVELAHKGMSVDEVLRRYRALGWTQQRIADECHVTRQTVSTWLREYGIEWERVA
jgi:DNA invertase Pin-like site-specific DNA recombinase